jgi:Lytic transglycolase
MFALPVKAAQSAPSAKSSGVLTAVLAGALAFCAQVSSTADAKTPGTVHCYGGYCHRINSIDEMDGMVGRRGFVTASFYDDCSRDRFNPCGLTSSGAVFRPDLPDNAASPIFPDGTVLLTYNPATKLAAVLRVTSTGPYRGDRTLDVSRATAEHLGFAKRGVAPLEVVVLKSPDERDARYKKLRTYEPVPGFIGRFNSFEAAHDRAVVQLHLETGGVVAAAADERADIERWLPRERALEVSDAGPEVTVAINQNALDSVSEIERRDGSDVISIPEISVSRFHNGAVSSVDVEEPLTLLDQIASLLETARKKARLDRGEMKQASLQSEAADSDLPFSERFMSFIKAAKARARVGVIAAGPETLASR